MVSPQNHYLPERTESSLMKIVPSNVVCPRCYSRKLHHYGKDPQGFQKYRCLVCKRQFAPDSPLIGHRPGKRKYPSCPKCGKASFLHHDYTYYSNYRCGDKSCYHSFFSPKLVNIKPPSSALRQHAFSMKRMRHPLHIVIAALNYYFMANVTMRKASQLLSSVHQVHVSHVTISKWIKRFTPVFQHLQSSFLEKINLSDSDEWHFDETYVKINGKDYYLWLAIDSETRFVLDFNLSPYRNSDSAFSLVKSCRDKFGAPRSAIVSDRYFAYQQPVKLFFSKASHIRVEDFHDVISNNLIEAFNGQLKAWYNQKRGFGSFDSANRLLATFIYFYNFLRPHSSLGHLTPAQVAGLDSSKRNRDNWFLVA